MFYNDSTLVPLYKVSQKGNEKYYWTNYDNWVDKILKKLRFNVCYIEIRCNVKMNLVILWEIYLLYIKSGI